MLAILFAPNSTKYGTFLELTTMPYGRDFGVGEFTIFTSPVFGFRRPTTFAFCAVKNIMPLWSHTSVCTSFTFGSGIGYCVTLPVFGSSLPMWLPKFAAYPILPSLSSMSPCGPAFGGSGYSLIWCVFGSMRPSRIANCPVYQIAPSGVASGSCGREPGVGTSHSSIDTLTGPGTTTAAGFGLAGKLLARYCTTVSNWSLDNGAPTLTIMLMLLRHSSSV